MDRPELARFIDEISDLNEVILQYACNAVNRAQLLEDKCRELDARVEDALTLKASTKGEPPMAA